MRHAGGLVSGRKDTTVTEDNEKRIGLALAKLLRLKARGHDPDDERIRWEEPRYRTEWGTKTARGLYLSILACIAGAKEPHETNPEPLHALALAYDLLDRSEVRDYITNTLGEQAELHRALNAARPLLRKARP